MVFGDAMLSTTLSPAIGWCLGKQWDEQRRSRYIESTCWRATDQPEVLDSHFSWGHGWYGSVDQWYQYQTTKLFYIEPCLKAPGWRHPLRFPRSMEKKPSPPEFGHLLQRKEPYFWCIQMKPLLCTGGLPSCMHPFRWFWESPSWWSLASWGIILKVSNDFYLNCLYTAVKDS